MICCGTVKFCFYPEPELRQSPAIPDSTKTKNQPLFRFFFLANSQLLRIFVSVTDVI